MKRRRGRCHRAYWDARRYAASGTKSSITKLHARSLPVGELHPCFRARGRRTIANLKTFRDVFGVLKDLEVPRALDRLEAALRTAQSTQARAEKLNTWLETLKAEIFEAEQEKERTVTRVAAEIAELRRDNSEKVHALVAEREALTTEVASLRAEHASLTTAVAEIKALAARITQ